MASSVCPLCLSEIGKATSFKCPGCESKYHKDCAADAGECIVVGCSAAAKSKVRSNSSAQTQSASSRAAKRENAAPRKASWAVLAIAVAASLFIGIGVGYSSGESAGYDRGYTLGFSTGDDAGYSRGRVDGCEWVFDQLSYQNLIGYNPGAYYYRYGSTYIARSQCS
jgi:hypothetical protein